MKRVRVSTHLHQHSLRSHDLIWVRVLVIPRPSWQELGFKKAADMAWELGNECRTMMESKGLRTVSAPGFQAWPAHPEQPPRAWPLVLLLSSSSLLSYIALVHQCTCTHSPHPPPWPGHLFPSSAETDSFAHTVVVYPYTLTASSFLACPLIPSKLLKLSRIVI
jgi:hypothetical protein